VRMKNTHVGVDEAADLRREGLDCKVVVITLV